MDKELTLVGHLEELRRRIIISLVTFAAASCLAFPLSSRMLAILKAPAAGTIERLVFFSPQEAFLIYMKISFFAAPLLSLPVILYQVWAFVSPAVDERLRRRRPGRVSR